MQATHPDAAFRAVITLTLVVWLSLELRQGRHRRPDATVVDSGSHRLIRISALSGALAGIVITAAVPSADFARANLVRWIGLVPLWCGIGLRLWAFHTLGQYFTFTVQTSSDQKVISTGPYRFVRHPSYTGVLLACLGIGLGFGNWLALIVFVGGVLYGLINRIRVEERALVSAIGPAYVEFAAERKRLVPYVW